jgi:hypothetical protein
MPNLCAGGGALCGAQRGVRRDDESAAELASEQTVSAERCSPGCPPTWRPLGSTRARVDGSGSCGVGPRTGGGEVDLGSPESAGVSAGRVFSRPLPGACRAGRYGGPVGRREARLVAQPAESERRLRAVILPSRPSSLMGNTATPTSPSLRPAHHYHCPNRPAERAANGDGALKGQI